MIERLKSNEDKIYRTESGEMMVVPELNVPQCISDKINEVIDAVNALVYEQDKNSDWYDGQTPAENVQEDTESRPENMQPSKIIYANKRLRRALGIAQMALVKLANDAYDMNEHIYIDGILNRIERITKGGKDE